MYMVDMILHPHDRDDGFGGGRSPGGERKGKRT